MKMREFSLGYHGFKAIPIYTFVLLLINKIRTELGPHGCVQEKNLVVFILAQQKSEIKFSIKRRF